MSTRTPMRICVCAVVVSSWLSSSRCARPHARTHARSSGEVGLCACSSLELATTPQAGAQYNYDAFRGQVALHNVDPGKGCPELRQLFPLVAALDAWLNLSVRNVAVLHEHNG